MKNPLFRHTHCAVLILAMLGCGGASSMPDKRPERTSASGIVTYNGTPIEGATVTLNPVAEGGSGASGLTNAEGMFTLGTFESGDGAIPGIYQVTVTKFELPPQVAAVSEDDPNYSGAPEEDADAEPKNLLPKKYETVGESGLQAEIGTESVTDLSFELVD